MKIFGLTGGIASGKSTVASLFHDLGLPVINADALYHGLIEPQNGRASPLVQQISEAFNDVVLDDGNLDRPKLGSYIFGNSSAREKLNRITHPAVGEAFRQATASAQAAGEPALLYDVPLLYESNKEKEFQQVIVVWVPHQVQLERLIIRDGLSRQDAETRLTSQLSLDRKRDRADHVIDNSGSLDTTRIQVEKLMTIFR